MRNELFGKTKQSVNITPNKISLYLRFGNSQSKKKIQHYICLTVKCS